MDTTTDSTFTINAVATAELRKRGTSRLWYRETDDEFEFDVPATYVARATSLLAPEVRPAGSPVSEGFSNAR